MYSAATNHGTKGSWNIPDVAPRFRAAKLAAAIAGGALIVAVIAVLVLLAALPAQGQTETVLYNFTGGDCYAAFPLSNLTFDTVGNLYGTTFASGCGGGTVFELSPNGNGGWSESLLYTFPYTSQGNPLYNGVIFDKLGNLYGTTFQDGDGYGTVFELSPVGGSWTETDLYTSTGESDGGNPQNGVTMDPAGNLWVITAGSGCCVPSTVDELIPSGRGWTEQTIASGSFWGAVVMDAAGNIFCSGWWNVVELTPNGSGGWTQTVIWPGDGAPVYGTPALDKAGNLYVTTGYGGAHCGPTGGCGAVYKLSPGKTGWTAEILFSFGGKDGKQPGAGVVLDAAGNIYGTTVGGGISKMGTIYELVPPAGKSKKYKEKVLWSLNGTDGAKPHDSLILDSASNLYGTAELGGSGGYGVVFEVTP